MFCRFIVAVCVCVYIYIYIIKVSHLLKCNGKILPKVNY